MIVLSNPWLQTSVYPEQLNFTLTSSQFPDAKIESNKFGLHLQGSAQTNLILDSVDECFKIDTSQGPINGLCLRYLTQESGVELSVELELPPEAPFLLQRMKLRNNSARTIHPERFLFSDVQPGGLSFSARESTRTAFYSNGWQSWSPSVTLQYGQRHNRSKLFGLSHPMLYDSGTPITWQKSKFSSDMFAALLDHDAPAGLICGFLSQKQQFGSLTSTLHPEPDLQVWANCDQIELSPGQTLESDWLAWQFFDTLEPKPFDAYFTAVAAENQARERISTPVGWCSWYYYFQNITPQILRKNLQSVQEYEAELPLDFFQIDDGFQQDVGSWLKFHPNFPQGVKGLSREIKAAGFTPGLWLAPFIVEHNSTLTREHPHWLLRNKRGKPVNSGFVWNRLGSALDLTHLEVQQYLREVISTAVGDWGFPYLKLDFLYAAALSGQHADLSKTRAQILRQGIEMVREEAGEETILLGCGCPIGPAIGVFDIMRISADVSPDWEPQAYGISFPFRKEPNMPSARNAIQNILTRSIMEPHLWANDPDCLLVRQDSNLSLAEVQSLATAISLTGGAFLISDDMTRLSPDRLKLAASLLPVLPPNPEVPDLFHNRMPAKLRQKLSNVHGNWQVIALFNWSDQPCDLVFDPNDWGLEGSCHLMREFWTGELAVVDKQHTFSQVPAHGVRLVAIRPVRPFSYVGSDLHISQGMEIVNWVTDDNELEFQLNLGHHAEGNCYLWVEAPPRQVFQNGNPTSWQTLDEHLLQIPVSLQPETSIKVTF